MERATLTIDSRGIPGEGTRYQLKPANMGPAMFKLLLVGPYLNLGPPRVGESCLRLIQSVGDTARPSGVPCSQWSGGTQHFIIIDFRSLAYDWLCL